MTKFCIAKEDAESFKNIGCVQQGLKTVTDNSILAIVEKNTMTIVLPGSDSSARFTVGIVGTEFDGDVKNDKAYYTLDYDKFYFAILKFSMSGDVHVSMGSDGRCIIENSANGTKVSLSCFQKLSPEESEEIATFIDAHLDSDEFKNGAVHITYTPQLAAFTVNAMKYMALSSRANSVEISKTKLRFGDILAFSEFTLPEPVLDSDKTVLLTSKVIQFLDSIGKFIEGEKLTVSADGRFIYIDCPRISTNVLMAIEESSFTFPNAEEISTFSPDKDNCLVFTLSLRKYVAALDNFNGLFDKTSWKQSPVSFIITKELLDQKKIRMHYDDLRAEVNAFLEFDSVEGTADTSKEYQFMAYTDVCKNYMTLSGNDTFKLYVSPLATTLPHGQGVHYVSGSIDTVAAKVIP